MSVKQQTNKIERILLERYDHQAVAEIVELLYDKLGISRLERLTEPELKLTEQQRQALSKMLDQLAKGIPVQHVIGHVHFQGMRFEVGAEVLIPRPETEELVELIKTRCPSATKIVDVGTGSGVIACSMAKAFSSAKVCGLDVSEGALLLAEKNAVLNKLDVSFKVADILKCDGCLDGYDVVVSNPPYIPLSGKDEIAPLVRDHEPHLALFSTSPLEFYRVIGTQAIGAKHVFFECNCLYAYQTAQLMLAIGHENSEVFNDSSGLPRFVHAW